MKTFPKKEAARIKDLRQYKILDTEPEKAFDDLTRLAAYICGTPIALINLIDENRQWLKAKVGLNVTEMPLNIGLCPLCIERKDVVVIFDTLADERFATNPAVTCYPYVRFYAGVPLITAEGNAIGTLCVADQLPRQISSEQVEALWALSRQAVSQLELRRNLADLAQSHTECARAEESLRLAAAKNLQLAQAIAAVSDGVTITDPNQPDNPIIYSNPAFSEITGYQPDEIIGRNARLLQGPGTDPQTVAQIRDLIASKREVTTTLLNYRKDGQPFWNELKISPVFSDEGALLYFVGIHTDITERKQLEAQLHQREQELSDFCENGPLGMHWVGSDGRILWANQTELNMLGYTREEYIGHSIAEFHADPEVIADILQRLSAKQTLYNYEARLLCKDGSKRHVLINSNVMWQDEEFIHTRCFSQDITEKKQLEAQFLRSQRMESLGTLAGGMAHDLNNVLAPILMASQLLQLKLSDVDARSLQMLQTLEANAKRGAALVKQVLEFARGVEGKRTLLQVGQLIEEIEQFATETFPKSIELRTDVQSNLWTVSGDATQLHQVLMNLVLNARDAMPSGGTLRIEAENLFINENYVRMHLDARVGLYVAITVTDTGTGMTPEIIDRIFEPFFTTKELGKGTGLGLSTAIGIIKSHGGFVNVSSTVGEGTKFQVFLPAVEARETQSLEELELPQGNGELILVVDDEAAIREISKTTLETYNYSVITASDGIEAISEYVQHKNEISVVLVDMMMPSMDGVITIRTLQKMNPFIKFIAVSGLRENQQLAQAVGVTNFLSKPFMTKDLLQILHNIVGKK